MSRGFSASAQELEHPAARLLFVEWRQQDHRLIACRSQAGCTHRKGERSKFVRRPFRLLTHTCVSVDFLTSQVELDSVNIPFRGASGHLLNANNAGGLEIGSCAFFYSCVSLLESSPSLLVVCCCVNHLEYVFSRKPSIYAASYMNAINVTLTNKAQAPISAIKIEGVCFFFVCELVWAV